ncbi:MAG TPA: hypothetical protein VFO85_00140, partial [Vicinamibacteria bacterium]|nr:hypothetical protein [Vicinamibacteria bacterium]
NVQRLRIRDPQYTVLASCGPREAKSAPLLETAKADPCSAACAPLARGLLAWQREATEATGTLAELAGKATTLELDVTTQKAELQKAEAAPSRPRALLERISRLQDRIKAAQAELARITRVSQEVQKHLAALQQAGADTGAAGERCQSQCRARQTRTQRSADKTSGPGTAQPAGAAAAGGGGVGAGAIIAGGAAVAAGGVAVVAAQGGDDEPPPTVTGTWAGTRTTTTRVPALCIRVYNETWNISQSGNTLSANITATAQSCGTAGCGQNCTIFAFPREHPGSLSGDTALFYVFPGLQVPSCILPLRLQGDTLSGTMPACDTGAPDVLTDVVTLRRTGR